MKKRYFCLLAVFVMAVMLIPIVYGVAVCSVKSGCEAGDLDMGGLSGVTDAHFEMFNSSAYTLRVCCEFTGSAANNSCSATTTSFIRASGETDAHIELNNESTLGYRDNCVSAVGTIINISYVPNTTTCTGYDSCLFTVSSGKDAHVASCDGGTPYNLSVCIKESLDAGSGGSAAIPEFSTIGMVFVLSLLGTAFIVSRRRKPQNL